MTENRKNIPPHRCFFTWDIHYACNYRCTYCYFYETWEEEKKKNRYPGLDRWKQIWDDIYERYGEGHLHISGGEPFHYPDFIELVVHLTKHFTVEFDTNLSFDVDEFMSKVGPERVKFATAFHPQFAKFDVYLKKVVALKQAGYDLGVNYVAYPEQLKEMKFYRDRLAEAHISFDVMPFRGKYQGKEYPQSYTQEEIDYICECDPRTAPRMLGTYGKKKPAEPAAESGATENKPESAAEAAEEKASIEVPQAAPAPAVSAAPEPPKAAPAPAHPFAATNPNFGKDCRMGQMYVKIHSNGNAYRCCLIKEQGLAGNLIDGTFAFYEDPKPCEYDKCPCWVAMVIGNEPNWLFHWVTPKVHAYKHKG